MRVLLPTLICLAIVACQPADPKTYQASTNLKVQAVPGFLHAVDALVDSDLDVAGLVEFGASVPVDDEKQQKIAVVYQQDDTMVLYHVWRENADSVHLYFSTPSEGLAAAIESEMERYSASQ